MVKRCGTKDEIENIRKVNAHLYKMMFKMYEYVKELKTQLSALQILMTGRTKQIFHNGASHSFLCSRHTINITCVLQTMESGIIAHSELSRF